jgi:hypothetical protein
MKKIIYIMTLIAAVFVGGCESESYRAFDDTQVKIEQSNVTFTAAGGTGTIVVADTERSVTATTEQSWCKLSVSGNTITVTVEPNLDRTGRSALVTIKAKDKIQYVPVSQAPVYLRLDSYEDISFLGKGGTVTFSYECEVPVTVVADAPWVSGTVQGKEIVLKAVQNPEFLSGRTTKIKIVASNSLVEVPLNISQGELITSYEPDPNVDAVSDFLNLKNYDNNTYSRYKITTMCSRLETLRTNLKTAYPIFQEMRIQAPRSTYKASIIFYNLDGTAASYYYWNCTNGLVPVAGSKSVAAFVISGNSYSGTTAPYTSNTNYTQLNTLFSSSAGFTIMPDGNAFWFRSVANPLDYFRVEPF